VPLVSKDDLLCLQNFESRQERVSTNTCLRKYRTQSRAFDPTVIGYGHWCPRPILILMQQSNMATCSHYMEPETLQSPYDVLDGDIDRELGSHTAIVCSRQLAPVVSGHWA
jgi:hypothetical protein